MEQLSQQLMGSLLMGVGNTLHALAGTASVVTYTLSGIQAVEAATGPKFLATTLAQGQLLTTDSILYTVPGGTNTSVSSLIFANTSASIVSGIQVSINGAASAAGNQILSSFSIPANGCAIWTAGVLRVYDASGNLYQTATSAFDATAPSPTTPLIQGVVGTAVTTAHRDHQHQSPGGVASIVAATAGIQNVETQVVGATLPAGYLAAGTVLEFEAYGTITSTVDNVVTLNLRIGTTTLTGNIPAALAIHCGNAGTVTAAPFFLRALVTCRTAGASGTIYGWGIVISASTGATTGQAFALTNEVFVPSSVAVDTTAAKIAELTCVTAATTTTVTFQAAQISLVKL